MKCQDFSYLGSWIFGARKKLFKVFRSNKRRFRADGLPLHPSALRPRLLVLVVGASAVFPFMLASETFAASLTLTIPSEALKLDFSPSADAAFKKTEAGVIDVSTNALAGFTLSIKSKTDNKLVSGEHEIASISENISEETFQSDPKYNNMWGFNPSKFNSLDNTNFLPAPSAENSTIEKTTDKNDSKISYNFVIGAKIDSMQPNGEYKNTFVISATANAIPYNIKYELNQGEPGELKNPQTGESVSETIQLDSTTPTRNNYKFLGWCDVETTDKNCNGNTYQPGGDYTLKDNKNDIKLYARWEEDIPTMQNFDCSTLSQGQTTTLMDIRDKNTYTVAKLKDGKCWMTQNLRIQNYTLTPEDSDVSTKFNLPASSSQGFNNISAVNVFVDNHNSPSYSGHYTFCAATANSQLTTGDAPDSICPKSWHLPTVNEYNSLLNKSGNNLNISPANFINNGYWYQNSGYIDGVSIWWSSTSLSIGNGYHLRADNLTSSGSNWNIGWYVRCSI